MDVACNGLLFTLRKVLSIDNNTVSIQIYISDSNNINGIWSEASELTKQIPKSFCFYKKVELTQKNTLEKRFNTQLCKKIQFLTIVF